MMNRLIKNEVIDMADRMESMEQILRSQNYMIQQMFYKG